MDLIKVNVETNPAVVYLSGLAGVGRTTMTSTVSRIAEIMGLGPWIDVPWHMLKYEHVMALRTKLTETYAPATVNKYLCAVRGIAREAWRLGQMDAKTYQRIADIKGVNGTSLPAGRALEGREIDALMEVSDIRDMAIVAVGYMGLRRAEIVRLNMEDVEERDGYILRVVGKRNKQRIVYLVGEYADALREWIRIRGEEPGPLFWRRTLEGEFTKKRLSGEGIRFIIVKRAKEAGLDHTTPHDLRRTLVSDLLDKGVDISTVAAIVGHDSLRTTQRYDRRGEAAKRKAMEALTQ